MGLKDDRVGATDHLTAEMVECVPPPPVQEPTVPAAPESSPTDAAADATIEQTGADPPPRGSD